MARTRRLAGKRCWWGLLAFPVLVAGVLERGDGQETAVVNEQDARISVDVNLVVLHATVSDRRGQPVSGLQQQDFAVYEDDVPQSIRVFAHEDVPVAAGLVVDHSGSMGSKLAEVSKAARTFVELSNPDDRMFVINFNEHVFLGLPAGTRFTGDPVELERAISQATATGRTALYDGIVEALEQLRTAPLDRKVLVVISDGGDNASKHTLAQVLKLAGQSSVTIYTVGIYEEDDPDRNPKVLRSLARATGGISFISEDVGKVTDFCTHIAHDIRSQYTIGYLPSEAARPGDYRTVRVAIKSGRFGKLNVRTREGYFVSGESPLGSR